MTRDEAMIDVLIKENDALKSEISKLISTQELTLNKIRAEIRHFMFDINPSSSESDYACNYILDIIDKHTGKEQEDDKRRNNR